MAQNAKQSLQNIFLHDPYMADSNLSPEVRGVGAVPAPLNLKGLDDLVDLFNLLPSQLDVPTFAVFEGTFRVPGHYIIGWGTWGGMKKTTHDEPGKGMT